MSILDYFSRAFVINLPERTDRRRDMENMLKRVAPSCDRDRIEIFPATRPESAEGFPSIGARGCFLSHLGVLRKARAEGLPDLLVMEDDLEICETLATNPMPVIESFNSVDWDMVYLGHALGDDFGEPSAWPVKIHVGPIGTTHFYAVKSRLLPNLIDFLELVLKRPAGHPDGGPMHVDGAFSTFRAQNPAVKTLVACPNLGWQRSSRSDITSNRLDRIPGVKSVAELLRRLRRKLG